jgi:hypothetical protein
MTVKTGFHPVLTVIFADPDIRGGDDGGRMLQITPAACAPIITSHNLQTESKSSII